VRTLAISSIIFACIFGGSLLGMILQSVLPERHLSSETKDVVKLAMGLIGTMTALLLGLLVASAKTSYDQRRSELVQMSANFVLLDRVLAHYGPETKDARELLHGSVARLIATIWSQEKNEMVKLDPATSSAEIVYDKIQQLQPKNDAQRSIQSQALSMAISLGQTRWLLFAQSGTSISIPFLVVIVLWLTIIFASFGLFAPRNLTAVVSLLLAALSVSGAIFLVLELDRPFEGLLEISSDPLRNALNHLGK
jgi:hypothetical protein